MAEQFRWGFSGLKVEVERCPEAETNMQTAVGLGAGAWGTGWLLGWSPVGRLLGAAVGASVGALANRYHVYIDWDPDRARGEPDLEPTEAR